MLYCFKQFMRSRDLTLSPTNPVRFNISHELKSRLKNQGIYLITYHRKNMKSVQLPASDEYRLKQCNKIETLFSLLKGQYNLVTSKARSITGFLSGIYASLCADQLSHPRKPTIQIMESLA